MVWMECTGVPGALGVPTNIEARRGGCKGAEDSEVAMVDAGEKAKRLRAKIDEWMTLIFDFYRFRARDYVYATTRVRGVGKCKTRSRRPTSSRTMVQFATGSLEDDGRGQKERKGHRVASRQTVGSYTVYGNDRDSVLSSGTLQAFAKR